MDAGRDASVLLDASDPDSGSAECVAVVSRPPAQCGSDLGWLFDGVTCVEGCSDQTSSFAAAHDCAVQCAGAGYCNWEKVSGAIVLPLAAGQEYDGVEICTRSDDLPGQRADLRAISNRFLCPTLRADWCPQSACGIEEHFVVDEGILEALCAASLLPYVEMIQLITLV